MENTVLDKKAIALLKKYYLSYQITEKPADKDFEAAVKSGVYVPKSSITHDETCVLLSKLSEAKHHIDVKLDMDELDVTSVEVKATYNKIRDWVKERYGFHVTNLNIAQVKQKHGIIERENYNKSKSENSRQPGCPEEKVKAIEDALKHFRMI